MAHSLLLKNVLIVAPSSPYNGKTIDVLILKGKIATIDNHLTPPKDATIFEVPGACLSIGWIDVGAQTGDPGFEHREDLTSVAESAMIGGFTALAPYPNTFPVVDNKTQILYIKNKTHDSLVDFYPIGAVSQSCAGKDLAEILDMRQAGAVAFSDGDLSLNDAGLCLRALRYVKIFDGLIVAFPNDETIAGAGQMNEGFTSVSLGLTAIPSMAEELMIQRDLQLLEYSESKLHLANISAARSVDLVREAKKKGLNITASVTALNLAYDDKALSDFDVNFKVMPPLRAPSDREALWNGLADGAIDFISANHVPIDAEGKNIEFPYAAFGALGLETAYAVVNTALKNTLSQETLIEKYAVNARKILNLPIPEFQEGANANITLFHPDLEWTIAKTDFRSKSINSPLIGARLKGKILGVINKGQWRFFDYNVG